MGKKLGESWEKEGDKDILTIFYKKSGVEKAEWNGDISPTNTLFIQTKASSLGYF